MMNIEVNKHGPKPSVIKEYNEAEDPSKWVFKVLEGLPPAEIDFRDFNSMKVFSAHLSALYPDIVTTYDKVEDLDKELLK